MPKPVNPPVPNLRPVHPGDQKRSRVLIPADDSPIPIPSGTAWAEDARTGWYPYVNGTGGLWVPQLTSTGTQPNLGTTGEAVGKLSIGANWVFASFYMEFGSGGGAAAGTGEYQVEGLPFDVDLDLDGTDRIRLPVGRVTLLDDSAGAQEIWTLNAISRTQLKIRREDGTAVTNLVPWTWAGGDSFTGWLMYPAVLR